MARSGVPKTLTKVAIHVLAVSLILLTAGLALVYFLNSATYDDFFGSRDPLRRWLIPTLLHIGPAVVALLVGGLQFNITRRKRRPFTHRLVGAVYVAAVLASGAGVAAILPRALGGPSSIAGFLLLLLFWLATTILGLVHALRHDRGEHRAWMARSYALTLAAVSLRLQMVVLTGLFHWPFETAYAVVAWTAWVPNLLICELLMHHFWSGPDASSRPINAALDNDSSFS